MVKSTYNNEQLLLRALLSLHCGGKDIELDPTYSKGNFYKQGLNPPKFKFDIDPQIEGVRQANAESLPLPDESVEVIMFDPPFLATTGGSLKKDNDSNKINKRFGVYPNEKALHEFYNKALSELYRVCKKDGILIFKCQDKVSSGKQYFCHCFIHDKAIEKGWYAKDLFILLAKNRIVADWQLRSQKHARKFHSYFWVFQKIDKKIIVCA